MTAHQYIDRRSCQVITEKPIGDQAISFLYNSLRENVPAMFRALTSARMSGLLGFCHYDLRRKSSRDPRELFARCGADWHECLEPLAYFCNQRRFFERQIRYWETRPMDRAPQAIVSPADARVLIGSFDQDQSLFIKDKFFDLEELLASDRGWNGCFSGGHFAVFRLTPDKYHYNHVPVSGQVVDIYQVDGRYHSCNPTALIAMASLYSKNRRVVTIIDTDVTGGSQIGLVAMVEIVALMIGDLVQCYSCSRYDTPMVIKAGMFLSKGQPKSLFRPGSSTDVLIFAPKRIAFADDLSHNSRRQDVQSRFSSKFGRPLVETDVLVRSTIGRANESNK